MIEIDIPSPAPAATTDTAAATPEPVPAPAPVAAPVALGRRKTAVARVRMKAGDGKIQVNGQEAPGYFTRESLMLIVQQPFEVADEVGKWDVIALLNGGGKSGQAGALRHGIARALVKAKPDARLALRKAGLLTRDPRQVERQKPGQPGARKKFQFSKR